MGAVGVLLWQAWLEPRVGKMLVAERAATEQRFAMIASAAAARDTAMLSVFAKYGVPQGPPGR